MKNIKEKIQSVYKKGLEISDSIIIKADNFLVKVVKKSNRAVGIPLLALLIFGINTEMVFATDTSAIDSFIRWVVDWVQKVGCGVAVFGGIQIVMGMKQEDAEAKTRGLKTLACGLMLAVIREALPMFGIK